MSSDFHNARKRDPLPPGLYPTPLTLAEYRASDAAGIWEMLRDNASLAEQASWQKAAYGPPDWLEHVGWSQVAFAARDQARRVEGADPDEAGVASVLHRFGWQRSPGVSEWGVPWFVSLVARDAQRGNVVGFLDVSRVTLPPDWTSREPQGWTLTDRRSGGNNGFGFEEDMPLRGREADRPPGFPGDDQFAICEIGLAISLEYHGAGKDLVTALTGQLFARGLSHVMMITGRSNERLVRLGLAAGYEDFARWDDLWVGRLFVPQGHITPGGPWTPTETDPRMGGRIPGPSWLVACDREGFLDWHEKHPKTATSAAANVTMTDPSVLDNLLPDRPAAAKVVSISIS